MKDEKDFNAWYELRDTKKSLWESAQHTMRDHCRGIATTNGNFDLFHLGHLLLLKEACRITEVHRCVLYVLVNAEESVQMNRGRYSYVPLYYRMRLIQEIFPDVVVWPIVEQTPQACLEVLRPTIHFKGDDWVEKPMPEVEVVRRWGGVVSFIPITEDIHSSYIVKRVLKSHRVQEAL
jgi:cytidyltransferase-like protein